MHSRVLWRIARTDARRHARAEAVIKCTHNVRWHDQQVPVGDVSPPPTAGVRRLYAAARFPPSAHPRCGDPAAGTRVGGSAGGRSLSSRTEHYWPRDSEVCDDVLQWNGRRYADRDMVRPTGRPSGVHYQYCLFILRLRLITRRFIRWRVRHAGRQSSSCSVVTW